MPQGRYDIPMPPLLQMQLSMVIDEVAVGRLPDVPLPAGYVMRACRTGDAPSWADTLQKGGFTDWTEDRVLEYLEDPERREGSRVVEYNGEIVSATFASRISIQACKTTRPTPKSEVGVLDFVVTHPDHRGNGLARATCTSVAKFLLTHVIPIEPHGSAAGIQRKAKHVIPADAGIQGKAKHAANAYVSLKTDDWRFPAIHIYLSMGFKPVLNRDDMPDRWATVYQMLKEAGYDHS